MSSAAKPTRRFTVFGCARSVTSLVVVVESPTSEANMRAIFADLDARLAAHPEVGEYDQKI